MPRFHRRRSAFLECKMFSRLTYSLEGPVGRITLNRPDVHNAFDAETIAELTLAFKDAQKDTRVRVIVLSGMGKNFCAGADLNWMKASVGFTKKQNEQDALK